MSIVEDFSSLYKKISWYVLEDGSVVSFHKLFADKERNEETSIMIYSDRNTWPSITAQELGLGYVFMRNATTNEVNGWLKENDLVIKEIIEV